jgi:hypothetical protein
VRNHCRLVQNLLVASHLVPSYQLSRSQDDDGLDSEDDGAVSDGSGSPKAKPRKRGDRYTWSTESILQLVNVSSLFGVCLFFFYLFILFM